MEDDAILFYCNESELHWMARMQGLPILHRGIPFEELVDIVRGARPIEPKHLAGTNQSRELLERFIEKNIDRLRAQLPMCDGKCRSFMCTEGKHMSCFVPSQHVLNT